MFFDLICFFFVFFQVAHMMITMVLREMLIL